MNATHILVALANTCATAWTDTLPSACTLVYTAPKPKGPVLENTIDSEVATPTFKRSFVMPKFWGLVRQHWPRMVSGGMGLPARMAARLNPCFQHPVHPLCLKTQTVVPLTHSGAKTMTKPQGRTAPALATSATPTQAHQLFADAVNAASMARWYTRRGNIAAATRKARQHLAALRALAKLGEVSHA